MSYQRQLLSTFPTKSQNIQRPQKSQDANDIGIGNMWNENRHVYRFARYWIVKIRQWLELGCWSMEIGRLKWMKGCCLFFYLNFGVSEAGCWRLAFIGGLWKHKCVLYWVTWSWLDGSRDWRKTPFLLPPNPNPNPSLKFAFIGFTNQLLDSLAFCSETWVALQT